MHFDPGELAAIGALFAGVCAAIGALLTKFWPVLTQSKMQREAAAAKLRQDAHEQVAQEYQGMIDRQQKQLDAQDRRLTEAFAALQQAQRDQTDCLVKNERLQARIAVVEAKLERVSTVQSILDIPTRSEAIIVSDADGIIREWNQAATVLFHWSAEEAIGQPVTMLVPPKYLDRHRLKFAEVLQQGRSVRRGPYLVEALTKGGALIPVEMTLSSWLHAEGDAPPVAADRRFSASIRRLITDLHGRVIEQTPHTSAVTGPIKPLPMNESRLTDDALPVVREDGGADGGTDGGGSGETKTPPGPEDKPCSASS